jgi:parvulin-like peptidyl-prolyl isomerase
VKFIRVLIAAILVLSIASLGGCKNKNVAATVNGEDISITELNSQVDQLKKQYPQMFEGADGEGRLLDFKQRLLDNLVNQMLVRQAAEKAGIKISDAEVDKQIEQLKSGFKDKAQFDAALKSAGMTVDSLRKQIKEQLVTQKLIDRLAKDTKVSDADIKAYYDKNKEQFAQKAAKRASHILFKPEDKAKAQQVLTELKNGGDFAALAKKNSIDTATASKGGDLGWPSTPFVTEFQAALDKLDVGQMSGLVQTPYGWHIIKVTEKRGATQQTLAQVKDQIKAIIIQQRKSQAYQNFLEKLRKDAKIEIRLEELKAGPKKSADTKTSK